jgi:hypothetical protein
VMPPRQIARLPLRERPEVLLRTPSPSYAVWPSFYRFLVVNDTKVQ